METMIEVRHVTKRFGGLRAVDDVSFSVAKEEIVGLIGPNGSGKTTLFNVISGYYKPSDGSVHLGGEEISGMRAHDVAARGLSRTFQMVRPFKNLSVFDNVLIGALLHSPNKKDAAAATQKTLELLEIERFRDDLPTKLPLAIKKKVEIGRALATGPRILLLDEVMGGLNTGETQQLTETVRELNRKGITIVIIEHKMRCIMSLAERIIVLDSGMKIAEGTPDEICKNHDVINAYLGHGYNHADSN
jgi:branched-chain amino acid transport system ATP-binding protein